MPDVPEKIHTDRLFLRKPLPVDAETVFTAYAGDPEVTRYLTWKPDQTREQIQRFLERTLKAWERGTAFAWAVTLKGDGQLIGMIDVRIETHANLGYVLARPYWNKGYMTEAVRAVTSWALAQEGIYRVWAVCDVENVASARVLEKAGFAQEGILRRWMVLPNRSEIPRDCYCYARTK